MSWRAESMTQPILFSHIFTNMAMMGDAFYRKRLLQICIATIIIRMLVAGTD